MRKASGFTIVEILIVVGIIGILSAIGLVGFNRYQADARDSERSGKAAIIVEALEKYYDKNGEYPGCPAIMAAPASVTTNVLQGIEPAVLQAPQRDSGELNSIKCTDLNEETPTDYFAYVGDNTSTCTSGAACVLYQLKYKEESTGEVVTIESRRKTGLSSTDVPAITVTTASFTQINTSWSAISGASSYDLQRATNSGFTTGVVTTSHSGTSTSVTGLSYNTRYYFRVRAVNQVGPGSWSPISDAITWSLAQPSCTATANSPNQITVSWTAVTHAASYTVEYANNSSYTSSTVSTGNTTTSKAITGLSPGDTIYARIKAVNGSYSSAWCGSVTATTIVPTPTNVAVAINSRVQMTVSWSAVTGASSYEIDYSTSSTFSSYSTTTSTSTTKAIGGLNQNTTYYARVRSVLGSYVSPNSSTASGTTPAVTLSGPVECAGAYSGRPAHYQLRLWVDEVSYNLAGNTSNINWTLYRISVSTTYHSYDYSKTWPWAVSINGTNWGGSSNSRAFETGGYGTTETIATGSLTVAHDSNGNATIGYAGSDGPGSNIFGSASCSGSYGLSDLR